MEHTMAEKKERAPRGGGDDMPGAGGRRRGGFGRKKVCRFCADRELKIDYKEASALKLFVTERSKIIPRRISGNCSKHQREVSQAIKRARILALLPFTVTHA
jgi:small subunit ribosomal protein S18